MLILFLYLKDLIKNHGQYGMTHFVLLESIDQFLSKTEKSAQNTIRFETYCPFKDSV